MNPDSPLSEHERRGCRGEEVAVVDSLIAGLLARPQSRLVSGQELRKHRIAVQLETERGVHSKTELWRGQH
jgi:hypothetical protein